MTNSNYGILISILISNILYVSCLSTKPSSYHAFDIPSFEVHLFFDSSESVSSPSTQLDISTKIKSATTSYLFDFFDSVISQYDHDQVSWSTFEGIELQLSLHTGEDGEGMVINDSQQQQQQKLLIAEMNGNVAFSRTKLEHGFTLDEEKVQELTQRAFMGKYAMDDYFAKIQNILPTVVSIKVQSKSNFGAIENATSGLQIGLIMLTTIMIGAFILLSVWFYREHYSKRGGKRTRNGHLLMDTDNHSDCYDEDELGNFTDYTTEQTFDSEPVQFIPVPARINEVTNGNGRPKATTKQPEVTPRRYVTPASPFELLYGAAFSHRDRKKVQKAKKKTSRFFNAPKAKQMKPLNTITEVNEDETNNNESFFPQLMTSITSYISEKMEGSSSSQKNKEDFVVFRDFPRHDGTPCVMFTPVGDVDWEAQKQNQQDDKKVPPEFSFEFPTLTAHMDKVRKDDNEFSNESSWTAFKDSNNRDGEVDSFVDKLESLMADRSRQYEERKKFEAELEEERKKRAEGRLREKGTKTATTVEEDEDKSKALVTSSRREDVISEAVQLIDLCSGKIVQEKESNTDYKEDQKATSTVTQQLEEQQSDENQKRENDSKFSVGNESEDDENKLESPRDVETSHFDSVSETQKLSSEVPGSTEDLNTQKT